MKNRIEFLRAQALNPDTSFADYHLLFYRKLATLSGKSLDLRYAEAFAYALENAAPAYLPGELLVGRAGHQLTEEESREWEVLSPLVEKTATYRGQDSHMAVDYDLLLREGIRGVIHRVEILSEGAEGEKADFYRAVFISLKAVITLAHRYRDYLLSVAKDSPDPEETRRVSSLLDRVPEYPAESFHEAMQSVHFLTFALSFAPLRPRSTQQFQLGRPDRYLLPYYEADLAAGRITREEAQELIDCLSVMINRRVHSGLSSGYMVGGRRPDQSVVQNALTEMFMETVDRVKLVYPAVGLCWTHDMNPALLEKAITILSHGRSHPALFNDDVIRKGLQSYGLSPEEASDYVQSTCVEITPVAASNVWVASPYTNMPQLLLDEMETDHPTYESLERAYFERLGKHIKSNFEAENANRAYRAEHTCNPLLSAFVKDCLRDGVDIERGGARYNWIMPSFVGCANLVDSLYALRVLVYEKKRLTLAEYRNILKSNFEGHEALRQEILTGLPKYGNDDDRIDPIFSKVTQHLVSECKKYKPMHQNGRLITSVFCWIMHEHFGTRTGATPDGRPAAFPLGDGSGPCQGREMTGPTASILSSTKWCHQELIGGVAVNMKFSKKLMSEASREKILILARTYLERGGFELQINVVDAETLLDARVHPENHEDLVVRVGGYSDYFTRLSPAMQEEVILRTEHSL